MPATNLKYANVQSMLDTAIGGPTKQIGFHGAFWRALTRDQFVAFQYRQVSIISLGHPDASGIVQALEGRLPFGKDNKDKNGNPAPVPNATFNRMPDGGPYMSDDDIASIRQWITNNCPA